MCVVYAYVCNMYVSCFIFYVSCIWYIMYNACPAETDDLMRQEIFATSHAEIRAATLFLKNFLKSKTRKDFMKKKGACIQIQKVIRGYTTRVRVKILAKEYAEWLILNPRDEDLLYPDDHKKKGKNKRGKGSMKRLSSRMSSKKLST